MRIVHLSDLHLGKRVNEFSMLEDQKYILDRILCILDEQKPQAVMIAGDVYDKSVPSAEAVELFDDFLVRLADMGLKVLVISGNHDSAERIAFGGRLMDKSGIYMAPVYDGNVRPVSLPDEFGLVHFYLLPFVKPAHVRACFPEEKIESYTDALRTAIEHMRIDPSERNVLVAHQFVTGSLRAESEELSVGGTDNVDSAVFRAFDYAALGHLHRAQKCGSERIRYSGTPLKYSFSEARDEKTVTILDMGRKGELALSFVPLVPRRDWVEIKGTYNELTLKAFYEKAGCTQDYVHVTLTDEEDIPDALTKLRVIYKNIMRLDYDNLRTRHGAEITGAADAEAKSPMAHFEAFYEMQNGQAMSEAQRAFLSGIIEQIWEEDK